MGETRTVLIADGNPKTLPQVGSALRELGCDVISVSDAAFVLTMAMRHKPATVVLGAQLPAGGTLTALRRLRGSVHTASIPVIALAPPGAPKQALLSAGVDECLEPPLTEADLVAALRRRLGIASPVAQAPAEILADPERLSALRATGLLDASPDKVLDRITRLAANVVGVPVALVSLVDDRRQFFKSQVGLPTQWAERRQTPLSHSFCQWVVSSQEELVVPDARIHPVLRVNKAVAELGVVAYAGVPMSAVTGQTIGSFCAIDDKPRHWSADELAALRNFAQLIDAQAVLSLPPASGLPPEARDSHFRAVTRAAAQGFLGAASLLRRGRPALDSDQRRDVIAIAERHSHLLIEHASDDCSAGDTPNLGRDAGHPPATAVA